MQEKEGGRCWEMDKIKCNTWSEIDLQVVAPIQGITLSSHGGGILDLYRTRCQAQPGHVIHATMEDL